MPVDLIPVKNSSNVDKIGYDRTTKVLHVHFKGGNAYTYAGFPETEFAKFQNAESKGKHFRSNIQGKYQHTKSAPVATPPHKA